MLIAPEDAPKKPPPYGESGEATEEIPFWKIVDDQSGVGFTSEMATDGVNYDSATSDLAAEDGVQHVSFDQPHRSYSDPVGST